VTRWLFTAASASYLASCGLGLGVHSGLLRTGRARWLHHALYVSTSALTLAAAAATLRDRDACRAGRTLLPAAVPLAVIPFLSARSWRHPALAASAAPFFAGALARSWTTRKRGRRWSSSTSFGGAKPPTGRSCPMR
jgi:hypothetical protein